MAVLKKVKYEKFAQYFFAGKGKRESAKLAGFSEKSAHTQANKLLKIPEVKKRIEELKKESAENAKMGIDEVLTRIATIARDPNEKTKHRLTALRYAGEAHGAFIHKVDMESSPPVIVPMVINEGGKE